MKIFSQFVACCFVLVLVSFTLLKLFIFKRSPLSTVDLKAWVTGVLFKKFCPVAICSRALPTLRLLDSGFMLMSRIHLVQGDKYNQFDSSICTLPVRPAPFVEDAFFPYCMVLASFLKNDFLFIFCLWVQCHSFFRNTRRGHQIPLQMVMSHLVVVGILTQDLWKKSQLLTSVISPALVFASLSKIKCPYMCGFLLASLIVFNWSVCLCTNNIRFYHYCYVVQLEVRDPDSSRSFFILQDCFGISGSVSSSIWSWELHFQCL